MSDNLGARMKEQYEFRTRYALPRRTYTILRMDGKSFHSLTRQCDRPFDNDFIRAMDEAALEMSRVQGAQLTYTQSDEISVLLTDFDTITTDMWFDGNIQKIVSVAASLATWSFNRAIAGIVKFPANGPVVFDARVFAIPDPVEVENYFIWRQQDATRNSINMAAQALFSHKECHKKNTAELQEMCFEKGVNWNDYPARVKRGGIVFKKGEGIVDPPIFTKERWILTGAIPSQSTPAPDG